MKEVIVNKLLQYAISIGGGILLAFETTIDYFMPCMLAIILDVITAWMLSRRVHKKSPDKSDGKFKSEYKYRVMLTLGVVFIVLLLAAYVDLLVRKEPDQLAVRATMCAFLFYEVWSCLENWSSENDAPLARALQRIMVNKAERHFNVKLSDILMKEDSNTNTTLSHEEDK